MSETAAKLLEQLLRLPEADRLQVAGRLWDSVGGEAKRDPADDLADDPEFLAELQRRLDAVAAGTADLVPWVEARQQMAAELERRRAARAGGGGS